MFSLAMIILVILLALLFDFINGFHDTANAIATSVSTKALSPRTAIMIAATLNFVGALSGTAVAATIGKSIVAPDLVTPLVLITALMGAIFWNLFTWYFGIPSSSSHALIGGLVGGAIAGFGIYAVNWQGFVKIFSGLILAPILGLVAGSMVMTLLFWIFKKASPARTNNKFRKLQILSACMASFAHGSNDAQKSMGIISLTLLSGGLISSFHVPIWVMLACALAMAMGTAVGGWRIIRTMGGKIFRIEPINGFAADFTSAAVIYSASLLGAPVSTTHVVSSAIMGVGAAKRLKGVRWNIARQILIAWFVTIPSAALAAMLVYKLIKIFL
ncbi:MAG: inorganic phosphate transporter [Syntrophomonas sp.]|uniref:inorganic phosphate transporter n=1 Tax=Syntrophomonas sp. TaxID=2053627 RepID=UPI0026041F59|nr:inorganic phosphate transporter [Syntrophomonas sp.]MDD2510168.1 inorganic phosphate transporter [Syntrophomonas sp.]MDD3879484.1 inorganic phosphate transporter [Syntrophomonas sp.]MDD4625775.1 inorganic phosphate transporter [Syntrophomonas sp.]